MRSSSVKKLVLNAMFLALTFLLGITPIGLIPLGAINVTILHIPVIAGTLFMGLKSGLLYGFAFGLCSIMSVYGLTLTAPSGLAAALNAESPLLFILMCMLPRLLVPVTTHYCAALLNRIRFQKHLSLGISSIIGSITNTIFYLGLLLFNYAVTVASYPGLLVTVGTIALTGGIPEAIAAGIVAPPIVLALFKIYK